MEALLHAIFPAGRRKRSGWALGSPPPAAAEACFARKALPVQTDFVAADWPQATARELRDDNRLLAMAVSSPRPGCGNCRCRYRWHRPVFCANRDLQSIDSPRARSETRLRQEPRELWLAARRRIAPV